MSLQILQVKPPTAEALRIAAEKKSQTSQNENTQAERVKEIKEVLSSYIRLSEYLDGVFDSKMPTTNEDKYSFLKNILSSSMFFDSKFKKYQLNHKGLILDAFENNSIFSKEEIKEVFVLLDEMIISQKELGYTAELKRKLLDMPNPTLSFTQHILLGILFVGSIDAGTRNEHQFNDRTALIESNGRNFRFGSQHITGHNQPGENGVKQPHTHLEFYVDRGNEKKESFSLHVLIK